MTRKKRWVPLSIGLGLMLLVSGLAWLLRNGGALSGNSLCSGDKAKAEVTAEQREGDYVQRLTSKKAVYPAGTEPHVRAELCYAGKGKVAITHVESPFLFFEREISHENPYGKVVDQPGFFTDLASGESYRETYRKDAVPIDLLQLEGTVAPSSSDLDFYKSFYAARAFPAGTYEIKVQADFGVKDSAERHRFSVPLTVEFR